MSDRIPHLRLARPADPPAGQQQTVHWAGPGQWHASAITPKPVLHLLAAVDVARAEQFLVELDGRTAGADLPQAMYLLGVAEGHLNTVIELIRTVTALPR